MQKIKTKSDNNFQIILCCLYQIHFCLQAATQMTPNSSQSDTMQEIYRGYSKIFSSLGKDFGVIAKLAGCKLDFTTQKGQSILEKINSISEMDKLQAKKSIKELKVLLK